MLCKILIHNILTAFVHNFSADLRLKKNHTKAFKIDIIIWWFDEKNIVYLHNLLLTFLQTAKV